MNDKFISAIYDAHYTLTRLSQDAGVSLATLHRLKTGKTYKPHYDTLKRIADCLDKTVEELF